MLLADHISGKELSPDHIDEAITKAASQNCKKAGSNGVSSYGNSRYKCSDRCYLRINEALNSKAFDTKTPIKTRQGK